MEVDMVDMVDMNNACEACSSERSSALHICCRAQAYALGSAYAWATDCPPGWADLSKELKDEFFRGARHARQEAYECYGYEE